MSEKSSGPCKETFLHSQMPEKSSGPRNEIFYMPPCHKSLAPGGTPGLAPGTRALWIVKGPTLGTRKLSRLGMQKVFFQGPEKSRRLFRHGRGKKSNSKDYMLQHSYCNNTSNRRANHSRNTCKSMGASKSISQDKSMDASNSRADNSRKSCNSMDAGNII